MTATYLATKAICQTFTSHPVMSKGITLEAIEIGNEADLFSNNGHRNSGYSINDYVSECVTLIMSVCKC